MPLPTSWSWGKGQGKRLDPVHLVGGWKKASVQRALRILLYRVFLPFLSKLEKETAVQESQGTFRGRLAPTFPSPLLYP